MVFPGLASDKHATAPLTSFCESLGYQVHNCGRGFNTGPPGDPNGWLDSHQVSSKTRTYSLARPPPAPSLQPPGCRSTHNKRMTLHWVPISRSAPTSRASRARKTRSSDRKSWYAPKNLNGSRRPSQHFVQNLGINRLDEMVIESCGRTLLQVRRLAPSCQGDQHYVLTPCL